jgi:hypothetical protein
VVALVVERVVQLAEALLIELLAVERIVVRDAAGGIDAADIVIADGVIELQSKVLLGLVVEVEEHDGAPGRDSKRVKDVVAAVDSEVGLDGAGLLEGHVGADNSVEFRLQMGVCEEEEGEGLLRRRKRSESGGRDRCREAGGSEQSEKSSAAG